MIPGQLWHLKKFLIDFLIKGIWQNYLFMLVNLENWRMFKNYCSDSNFLCLEGNRITLCFSKMQLPVMLKKYFNSSTLRYQLDNLCKCYIHNATQSSSFISNNQVLTQQGQEFLMVFKNWFNIWQLLSWSALFIIRKLIKFSTKRFWVETNQ